MTMGAMMSVFQRIDAIEARFGRAPQSPGGVPGVPANVDFEALLQRSAGTSASQPDAAPAAGLASTGTTLGSTAEIASVLDELGRLAAVGGLGTTPYGTGSATPTTELDRLAAIGALGVPAVPSVPGRDGTDARDLPSIGAVDGSTVATIAPPPSTTADAQGAVASDTPFAAEFERAGLRYGVPPRLLAAVGWVESRYQVDALSPDGAIGVMQIMPMTAQELGVDPHDPVDAIDGAARLLASHQRRFGSWDLALAAYHSGAGAVSRAGNQAPPRGAAYVERVHDRLEHA